MTASLTPFGLNVSVIEGRISLTDLWKEAGSPADKSLKRWLDLDSTKQFVATVSRILKVDKTDLLIIKRGKSGGTWGHEQITLEYAQYLDPRLAVLVNKVFLERVEEEKDPQKTLERAKNAWRRQGKTDKWISMRMMSVDERKSFTSTLKAHGVYGNGYKDCTNAIYKPLWGGGADIIRAKKNLPQGSNCRDFMTEIELAGVRLAELLAEENINVNNSQGNVDAVRYCELASYSISKAILNNRGKKI